MNTRVALLVVALCGCSAKDPDRFDWVVSHHDARSFSRTIALGDATHAWQRLEGFYPVQEGAWAWTASTFSVALPSSGTLLRLELWLSPEQIAQLKSVTLHARIDGLALPPETYRAAGAHSFRRALRPRLPSRPMRIELDVDPPFHPAPPDTRALGVVVRSISIEGG
jgi:hypothetical protein